VSSILFIFVLFYFLTGPEPAGVEGDGGHYCVLALPWAAQQVNK
jgi:hypothetical protein